MGNIEQYTSQGRSAELPLVYLMTGVFKDAGAFTFKHHENTEAQSVISVYHTELYVAGVQIFLYDVMANLYVVGGVDQLASFRANLGE
jgi:P2 family phage contractile tail tube protein